MYEAKLKKVLNYRTISKLERENVRQCEKINRKQSSTNNGDIVVQLYKWRWAGNSWIPIEEIPEGTPVPHLDIENLRPGTMYDDITQELTDPPPSFDYVENQFGFNYGDLINVMRYNHNALERLQQLPQSLRRKTVATGETGRFYLSGTKGRKGFNHIETTQISKRMEEIGYPPRIHRGLDNGIEGSYYQCHAEKQAAEDGNRIIGISRPMCLDEEPFFMQWQSCIQQSNDTVKEQFVLCDGSKIFITGKGLYFKIYPNGDIEYGTLNSENQVVGHYFLPKSDNHKGDDADGEISV